MSKTEHHYACSNKHEISILAEVGQELVEVMECPVERCRLDTYRRAANAAEVEKA